MKFGVATSAAVGFAAATATGFHAAVAVMFAVAAAQVAHTFTHQPQPVMA